MTGAAIPSQTQTQLEHQQIFWLITPAAQLLHPHPPSSTHLTALGQSAAHIPAQPLPLSQGINESKASKMKTRSAQ